MLLKIKLGLQNSGRCRQLVAIRKCRYLKFDCIFYCLKSMFYLFRKSIEPSITFVTKICTQLCFFVIEKKLLGKCLDEINHFFHKRSVLWRPPNSQLLYFSSHKLFFLNSVLRLNNKFQFLFVRVFPALFCLENIDLLS